MKPTRTAGVVLTAYPPIEPAAFVCEKCREEGEKLSYRAGKYSMFIGEIVVSEGGEIEIPAERLEIL